MPKNGLRIIESWKQAAKKLEKEVIAIYLAYRDPRVPWYARLFAALVVAYAFSPIDLIPDPIPVLGYLDDLVIVPLGVWLVLKMIPPQVMVECRLKAQEQLDQGKPVSWVGAVIIAILWLITAALLVWLFWRWWKT
jgi:uncharacterized membrane protein YkvA (DUF1232 family)